MFKTSIALFLLVSVAAANEVRRVQLGNELLVDTSPTNYAVKSNKLIEKGYLTVSIDRDTVAVTSSDCSLIRDDISKLNDDTLSLVREERAKLDAAETNMETDKNDIESSISKYELGGDAAQYSSKTSVINNFEYSGYAFGKIDDSRFTVRRLINSPGLSRMFVDEDTVTFVSSDGRVLMKPSKCLNRNEKRFVRQLRSLSNRQARS